MEVISTHALTRRYGSVVALDDVSVDVGDGVTGLVGANGAGKSTLIKLLLGLVAPSSGRATVLGFDAATRGAEVRARVGYMPEHDCLPADTTATEFVVHMARMSGIPASVARERAADTLRHVGLHEERYRPMGQYSTGMKQRVKLAQAIVHDPRLVLLDEPTNGLDPAGRDEMLDLVHRIGHDFGIAVLVTSHLLGELERISDHVVVIEAGAVSHQTTTASLTGASGTVVVEVDGSAAVVLAALETAGFAARVDGAVLEVDTDDDGLLDLVRDVAAAEDIGLVRLARRRRRMTELFEGDPA